MELEETEQLIPGVDTRLSFCTKAPAPPALCTAEVQSGVVNCNISFVWWPVGVIRKIISK